MSCKVLTIFKLGREEAGLTQEKASELLGISTRQLTRYENLEVIPDDLIVFKMMKIYKAEWLGYVYLQQFNNVGKVILPEITFEDIGLSLLKFFKEHSDIEDIKSEMIDIACDGVIDADEKPIWENKSKKELKELVSATLGLLLRKEKGSIREAI